MTLPWMKLAPWIAAGVLGLTALGMFAAQQRAAGAASAYATIVDQQQARSDSTLAARDAQNKVITDSLVKLSAAQPQLAAKARAAEKQTAVALDRLRQTLNEQQQEQLAAVVQGYETQLAVFVADTARLNAMNRLVTAQRDSAWRDVHELRALNDNLAVALDKSVRAQRSSGIWKVVAVAATAVTGAVVALK
jgi:chromosome segregation ATPase